jgi:protein-L-isoaspartate(D-aspartate) O-methyltransferase
LSLDAKIRNLARPTGLTRAAGSLTMDFKAARQQMIDQQVRAWEVLDPRVLDALAVVPRERFVPPAFTELAYADAPIPLPAGQSMLAPSLHGRILQAIGVKAGTGVLEVGSGSGYLAACLATLGGRVTTIELQPELAALSQACLRATGFNAVTALEADATVWAPADRYDVIVMTASLPQYDARYQAWLKPGGRLFVVVGAAQPMEATLVTRSSEGEFGRQAIFETTLDPLLHATRPSPFVF